MLETTALESNEARLRKKVERERRARLEAEALAEQGLRALYEQQKQVQLLHAIAVTANESTTLEAALQTALDKVCEHAGWPVGHALVLSEQEPRRLVSAKLWHLDKPERFSSFREITEATAFLPGIGLPGRVWESGQSVWIPDVGQDDNFPRRNAGKDLGVRTGFAFPVLMGTTVIAVLEFFSIQQEQPVTLWEVAIQIGTQLGRVFERHRAARELEKLHKQLLEASRQAGMAEVATAVLHNVGNVLNSVNVSATVIAEKVRASEVSSLPKVCELLNDPPVDLGAFITSDPRGQLIPGFLTALAGHLAEEHAFLLNELNSLQKNVEHIKEIVTTQQSYASVSGVLETLSVGELIEDALRLNAATLSGHNIRVTRQFVDVPPVCVDRHKVLQILVNLIRNAKSALRERGHDDKRLKLQIAHAENDRVRISVTDNGVGIPAENLTRIFGHGFTTKRNGHGFGLHSGALAAKQMGGTLSVRSEGPGQGATFILELPRTPENKT